MSCCDIVKEAYQLCYSLFIVFIPLILKLIGAAGTGNSFAIETITILIRQMFQHNNAVHILAQTGTVDINIKGETLHSFGRLDFHDLIKLIEKNDFKTTSNICSID
jgi:hypothetical protein